MLFNMDKSNRRCNHFELTLAQCELPRLHVFNALDDFCSRLIVAREFHDDFNYHLHCYLDTVDKLLIEELRDFVFVSVFGGEGLHSIHISTLKNKNHWIKYITKEDTEPVYKGVDVSLFHFAYRSHHFIKTNRTFNYEHAFIRQHPNYQRIIKERHTEFWSNHSAFAYDPITMSVIPDLDVPWVSEALSWIMGRFIVAKPVLELDKIGEAVENHRNPNYRDNGIKFKISRQKALWAMMDMEYDCNFLSNGLQYANLFIWGDTGVGKSVLAKWVSHHLDICEVVWLPCGHTDFEFSQVGEQTKLIVAEDVDADWLKKHRQKVLTLADQGCVSINVKCGPIKNFISQASFIVCSNYEPVIDEALARRFNIIEARQNGVKEVSQNGYEKAKKVRSPPPPQDYEEAICAAASWNTVSGSVCEGSEDLQVCVSEG